MRQVPYIADVFSEFFTLYVPVRIIELGTGTGEFTRMIYDLRKRINTEFDLITFEIGPVEIEIPENMIAVQCDIFRHIELIKPMIKENTLILCDNGNKIKEVRELIPSLKANCVIMAHDFGGQPYWGWEEIKISDVQDMIDLYGLSLFHQVLMLKGAWMSFKKY